MGDDLVARRLLKEQTRKELLDELKAYLVGLISSGEMSAYKSSDISDGYLFIIPDEQYREWFGETKQ